MRVAIPLKGGATLFDLAFDFLEKPIELYLSTISAE
jgi:hypothetical protein